MNHKHWSEFNLVQNLIMTYKFIHFFFFSGHLHSLSASKSIGKTTKKTIPSNMYKGSHRCGLKLCLSSLLSIFLLRAFATADDFSQGKFLFHLSFISAKLLSCIITVESRSFAALLMWISPSVITLLILQLTRKRDRFNEAADVYTF